MMNIHNYSRYIIKHVYIQINVPARHVCTAVIVQRDHLLITNVNAQHFITKVYIAGRTASTEKMCVKTWTAQIVGHV